LHWCEQRREGHAATQSKIVQINLKAVKIGHTDIFGEVKTKAEATKADRPAKKTAAKPAKPETVASAAPEAVEKTRQRRKKKKLWLKKLKSRLLLLRDFTIL